LTTCQKSRVDSGAAHFLTVARYVERNPLRAKLVERAEGWRWSSLWRRERGSAQERGLLGEWPLARPADWLAWVDQPQTDAEVEALRKSVEKGRPFGQSAWRERMIEDLGLQASVRQPGRPKKRAAANAQES
jgi:putative transposase